MSEADARPLIETVAELDSVPDGTLVMLRGGDILQAASWRQDGRRYWRTMGSDYIFHNHDFRLHLPVPIIWSPDVDN